MLPFRLPEPKPELEAPTGSHDTLGDTPPTGALQFGKKVYCVVLGLWPVSVFSLDLAKVRLVALLHIFMAHSMLCQSYCLNALLCYAASILRPN